MTPVSLLCNRFLKSLLVDEESPKSEGKAADPSNSDAEDDDDVKMSSDDD